MAEENKTNNESQGEVVSPDDPIARLMELQEKEGGEQEGDSGEPDTTKLTGEIDRLKKEVKVARDGQSGSAKEAAKLKAKLEMLESAQEKMKDASSEKTVKNIFDALNLDPENTILDLNDLSDTESPTSKVLGTLIAAGTAHQAKRILQEREKHSEEEKRRFDLDKERRELMQELEMSEDEFSDWWGNIKDKRPSLKQIYSIYNQDYLIKRAREIEQQEKQKQRKNVGNLHTSLAAQGGEQKSQYDEMSVLGMLTDDAGIEGL